MSTVTTVADLRAVHLGQTIVCHGWRGEFRSLALAHPGYIEVLIDAAPVWVPLEQPCRIEARP